MENSNQISEIFASFNHLKVLVIGDVMIDSYLWGKVDRISPEAPVPIVHITKREMRPGGAANVAINIKALGAQPILCSVTGDDRNGEEFLRLLEAEGLSQKGILRSGDRTTTVKTRVIGNNHQLLRVDDEITEDLNAATTQKFLVHCKNIINTEKPDVIILEDYDKGVLCEEVIKVITSIAKEDSIPVAVDPKKRNFNTYKNITLFKPNLLELKAGLKIDIEKPDAATLSAAVKVFLEERNIDMVMVTLSEAGVFIATNGEVHTIPAHFRKISDVSGAGDTVISVAALCLAAGLPPAAIAELSNLAGGLVCEMVGVVPIDSKRLMQEASKLEIPSLTTPLK